MQRKEFFCLLNKYNQLKIRKNAHFLILCAFQRDKSMKNIAIFASGSGTNAENIIKHFANHPDIRVVVVLSNNPKAGVLERAKKLEIPSFTFSREDFEQGSPVLKKLAEYHVDFIVLAGFLNIISEAFLNAYPEKVINIHPALLPKHGGKGMYGMRVHEAVIAAKDKKTGITIHYINEYYDNGEIIFQASCPVSAQDTPETVAQKVHALEYEHFPKVIERLWRRGSYEPPWIWSTIEIINNVRKNVKIPALLDTSGFGSRRGPYNCKKCTVSGMRTMR